MIHVPITIPLDLSKLSNLEIEKIIFDCQNIVAEREFANIHRHENDDGIFIEESDKYIWEAFP